MMDYNLDFKQPPIVQKDRLRLPGMESPGAKIYNKFFGLIAYLFNYAIKAKYTAQAGKTQVWYINANSFAKRCFDESVFQSNKELSQFIGQVKQQLSSKSNRLPKVSTPVKPSVKTSVSYTGIAAHVPQYKDTLNALLLQRAPKDTAWRNGQMDCFNQICMRLSQDATITTVQDFESKLYDQMKNNRGNVFGYKTQYEWALHHFADNLFPQNGATVTPPPGPPAPKLRDKPPTSKPVITPKSSFNVVALAQQHRTNLNSLLLQHAHNDSDWREAQLYYFDQICARISGNPLLDTVQAFEKKLNDHMKNNLNNTFMYKLLSSPWGLHHFADNLFQQKAATPAPQPAVTPSAAAPALSIGATDLPAGKKLKAALHQEYRWPSDHFPIAGSIMLGGQPFRFASYNVLHDAYLHHISGDGQGLNGSAINTLGSARNSIIQTQIKEMIIAGQDFIALQECSPATFQLIQNMLPQGYKILLPHGSNNAEGPLIINTAKYTLKDTQVNPFFIKSGKGQGNVANNKYINACRITDNATKQEIILLNTHLQQGNERELSAYIAELAQQVNVPILLLGDMNAVPQTIEQVLTGKALQHHCLTGNQATHINTTQSMEAYDQIHLILPPGTPAPNAQATHDPKEIFGPASQSQQLLEATRQLLKANAL